MTNREAYLDDLDELLKEINQLLSAVPIGKTKLEHQSREQAEDVAGIAGAARSTMTERAASWWTWTRELAENRTSVRSRATPLTVNPATR